MIKEIQKDVTTVESGVVLHQVNCLGVMGSGVALAIKNKWPKVYQRYVELHDQYSSQQWRLLGMAQRVKADRDVAVVNLFGQYDCGSGQRFTEYGSLGTALNEFSSGLWEIGHETEDIYIPYKMGCDRGGGDWNIVYDMIETLLDNDERTIYICSL
jgi:hypothetical protein